MTDTILNSQGTISQEPQNAGVLEYKCPCCGAGLTFHSQGQKMFCASCGNSFDVESVKEYNAALTEPPAEAQWSSYGQDSGSGDWKEGETEQIHTFLCRFLRR